MLKYVLISLAVLCVLALAILGVRGTTSRQPPVMFFDDMDDMPRYENQGGSTFFPDGRQMRPIPAGTVAWGRAAERPDGSLLNNDAAAYKMERIPLKLDMTLLQRGQKVFNINCAVCHGGFGNGNGITVKYGQVPPANYHADRLRQVTDGYLYQVITEGKGLMGPYGPNIRPEDRWAVVAYVRALQRAGSGTLEDVPANMRQELALAAQAAATQAATAPTQPAAATQNAPTPPAGTPTGQQPAPQR